MSSTILELGNRNLELEDPEKNDFSIRGLHRCGVFSPVKWTHQLLFLPLSAGEAFLVAATRWMYVDRKGRACKCHVCLGKANVPQWP